MSGSWQGQSTDSNDALPWDESIVVDARPQPHFVICWSADEPHRIGEVAPVSGQMQFGRGAAAEPNAAPRLAFFRQRPSSRVARPALTSRRLSRQQLEITDLCDGRVQVVNVGRCPLFVDGERVTRAVIVPGQTLLLQHALLLMLVERPVQLEPLIDYPAGGFAFGAPDPSGMVGESPKIWALRERLAFSARLGEHVLLVGPSGTGKELAARTVHALSSRAGRAFIARNAATFPESLLDAEVFGTARDYPNAGMPRRAGLVAEADGGTLFLDEIGELPERLQTHLLRVMDRGGEFQRLGEATTSRADVRFVAATNRSLNGLKHDFAARFKLRVDVPGLEQRREDIPLLIVHLIRNVVAGDDRLRARLCDKTRDGEIWPRIAAPLVESLIRHDYRTHARELERLLLAAIADSRDDFVALTPEVERLLAPDTESAAGTGLTARAVRSAIERANGNVTRAARELGLKNRYALYRLLKKLGIESRDAEG